MSRRRERTEVALTSTMYRAGRMSKVQLENVANEGLGASAPFPPGVGEHVKLTFLGKLIHGRVAWAVKKQFGLELADPLPVEQIEKADLLSAEEAMQRLKNSAGDQEAPEASARQDEVGSMRDALIKRLDSGTLDLN
jgi:hypothetical protein